MTEEHFQNLFILYHDQVNVSDCHSCQLHQCTHDSKYTTSIKQPHFGNLLKLLLIGHIKNLSHDSDLAPELQSNHMILPC